MDERQTLELVLDTIRREADALGYDELSQATADSPLYGGDNGIDSLSLVRVIALVERAAARQFGRHVVLADEKAMSMRSSPFRTARTLAELLRERLAGSHA